MVIELSCYTFKFRCVTDVGHLAGLSNENDDAVILDGLDFSSVLLSSSFEQPTWRVDILFPFWNGPNFSKPGTEIYAGRYNQYKLHWITSMGLTAGTHELNMTVRHDPPLVFDVAIGSSGIISCAVEFKNVW